jgi:hypothetical protein
MIANGALENKAVYTRFELQEFSQDAGVPRRDAKAHTEGNFLNIPTGLIDLFDMEGNPNEHQTSTGIADCPSPFPAQTGNLNNCRFDQIVGQIKCTPTLSCQTPQKARRAFDIYINAADKFPKDGILTAAEFLAAELMFNQTVFRKSLFDPSNGGNGVGQSEIPVLVWCSFGFPSMSKRSIKPVGMFKKLPSVCAIASRLGSPASWLNS